MEFRAKLLPGPSDSAGADVISFAPPVRHSGPAERLRRIAWLRQKAAIQRVVLARRFAGRAAAE